MEIGVFTKIILKCLLKKFNAYFGVDFLAHDGDKWPNLLDKVIW